MRFPALLMLAVLAFPLWAAADTSLPLYYATSTLTITRKSPPLKTPAALPWQKKPAAAAPDMPGVSFDVEVRDGMTMYNQDGWFNLSGPSENSGVLLAFSAPGLPPVVRMTQYAPLDILMIDHEGTITQIVPNIKLSDLDNDITPSSPILAYLFLNGGTCEKLSIKPGDIVEYSLFKRPPVVLSAPAK